MKRALLLCLLGAGCRPDLDETTVLDAPRLLAVRATPAEVRPGEVVRLEALFVDAKGARVDGPLDWALCTRRRGLTESGPVDPGCLAATGEGLVPLGSGSFVEARVPADACKLFGPDPPAAKIGEPAGRPVDPDSTGGYYQPLRVLSSAGPSLAEVRLRCGLAGATAEQVVRFEELYRPNQSPKIASFEAPATLAPGATATVRLSWDAPETYPVFDLAERAVVVRREAIRASFHATAGSFAVPRTGRAADDPATTGDNAFTAPTTKGRVTVWVVVRDDRGGVDFQTATIEVR